MVGQHRCCEILFAASEAAHRLSGAELYWISLGAQGPQIANNLTFIKTWSSRRVVQNFVSESVEVKISTNFKVQVLSSLKN